VAPSRTRIGLLLATTSVAALISGAAPQSARAACAIAVTGASGPVTNPGAVDCISITNANVAGDVTNIGSVNPGGITVTNSNIIGAINDSGFIAGGVSVDLTSQISGGAAAINITGPTFLGGIANAGFLSGTFAGIAVSGVTTFAGGISNSGTIEVTATGPFTAAGIVVSNVRTFTGGIANSGTVSAQTGILVDTVSTFAGGITNSGTIQGFGGGAAFNGIVVANVSAFSGDIVNSLGGTINARTGILICDCTSTFNGNVVNSGTINASRTGIVVEVATFTGGITNSGSITAGRVGILVQNLATFAGGITNSLSITAGGPGIEVSNVSAFSGDIVNTSSGTINAAVGMLLCDCTQTFAGNIINAGTINGSGGGIFVEVGTFTGSIINNGTISVLGPGTGIAVSGVTSFLGGITNTGTITALFNGIVVGMSPLLAGAPVSFFGGGIVNSGNIDASIAGVFVSEVATFAGGITNTGSGTITGGIGIFVGGSTCGCTSVGTFSGGINNRGTITAGRAGVVVDNVTVFQGGITNSGSISASSNGIFVGTVPSVFSGNIVNTGNITVGGGGTGTGIFVSSNVASFVGGITNTGTITAGNTAIFLSIGGMSVFNSGTLTAPIAIQFSVGGNTLTLGPGSTINGLVVATGNNDTLQLGGSSGSDTFIVTEIGPKYQNFTSFAKVDNATWTLTGNTADSSPWTVQQGKLIVDPGASLPNAPFTVQGGTFSVDGTVGGVTVNGGVLMGNGTLGGLIVNPGGTVAPGHSIGLLNINGPVSFTAGSFYQVETNAGGQADKIHATGGTGTATLTGGTVQALPQTGNYGPSTTYTILTADAGRTGTFSNVTSSAPFLIPSLSYDANDVFLTLTRDTKFFQNQAGTPNQLAVASALDTFPTGNALFLAAAKLTGGATQQALDRLSGEIHASVQSVMREDSLFFRQAILGRLRQSSFERGGGPMAALGAGGPLAYADTLGGDTAVGDALAYAASTRKFPIKAPRLPLAAPPPPERVWWVQGIGAWGKINGDGNAAEVNRNLGGVFTGYDLRLGNWAVGIAGGYTNSSVNVSARASSANIDAAHLGAYAGTSFGRWNVRTGAAVTWDTINTTRMIGFPGFFDQTTARYSATQGQVFGEVGYGMAYGRFAVEPFAGLAYVHLSSTSLAEAGGLAALAGGANKEDVGYSTLGVRAATTYVLADGKVLTPRASLGWQHAFGAVTPTANLAFQSAGIPFTIAGAPIARDAALVDAGADLRVLPQMTLGVSYLGVLGNSVQDHSVKGNFNWRW
jgi:outer membrane autotransporter protein